MTNQTKEKSRLISRCEELIKSFNPVIYSIDSYCKENLGDYTSKNATSDVVFIQQVLYGWFRERAVLEIFVNNFYEDNASRLLRADRTIYTVFSYLAIFRLDEMKFNVFKEFVFTQDPTKMYIFINYLFNDENLNSCLKADWIKVRDLSFVEDEIIASIENFIPLVPEFLKELEQKAFGIQIAKDAINESKQAGTFGLKSVQKKELTRPISPKITPPSIVPIPEPILIPNDIKANEMPSYLNKINLSKLDEKHKKSLEAQRLAVQAKYEAASIEMPYASERVTKYTKKHEELKREIEESRQKELAFDSAFVNIPPDFSKIPARIKVNKAAILREDFLFRKQQEHDVKLIKQYEEELRDASEFYQWQMEMKEGDEEEKLKMVKFRRDQARQAAVDARLAIQKLQDDNKAVGDLIREQEDIIIHKKEIERQIEALNNRMAAQSIAEVRDRNPRLAVEKVFQNKVIDSKKLRGDLESARIKKEIEDKIFQEDLNDKIRQQRAVNTLHKKFIKVFDPTESSGLGFLNEMSYMEMKERLESEKLRYEALEMSKRQEIIAAKERAAKDLEERALNIQKMREKRAEATRQYYLEKEAAEKAKKEKEEKIRQDGAISLAKELKEKREEKQEQIELLAAEEERIRRQQQYLGAALGAVEETKYSQLILAKERHEKELQQEAKKTSLADEKSKLKDSINRKIVKQNEKLSASKHRIQMEREAMDEKKVALQRLREEFQEKQQQVITGRSQHERTKNIVKNHNLYASNITADIQNQAKQYRSTQKA